MSLSWSCGPSTEDEVCTLGSAGLLLERLFHLQQKEKLNVCTELGSDLANGSRSHICYYILCRFLDFSVTMNLITGKSR